MTLLVTAAAIAVGVALIPHEPSEYERQSAELAQAREQRAPVRDDAMTATELDAMDEKVGAAVRTVVEAQHDDERAAAKAKLDALRKQKYVLEQRIAAAKAKAAATPHIPPLRIPARCLEQAICN